MRSNNTRSILSSDRLPPHDKEAERAVLAHMLLMRAIPPGTEALTPSDFYVSLHSRIWEAAKLFEAAGTPIDIVTVKSNLVSADTEPDVDRVAVELGRLIEHHCIAEHVPHYVQIIRSKAALRNLLRTTCDIVALAHSPQPNMQDIYDQLEKLCTEFRERSEQANPSGSLLRVWDLSVAAFEATSRVDWLVEPLMAPPDVVTVVGEGGVGKSKLAASVTLAVAFGRQLWGHFEFKRSGTVVYINEERPDLTLRHLHTLAPSMGIDPGDLESRIKLVGRGARPLRVTDPEPFRALRRLLSEIGNVALVVWDSLHVLHDKEENDNAQMTEVIELFRRICMEVGCCGLILHHTSKGTPGQSGPSARGASAIKDTVDGQFMVRRPKEDDPAELRVHQDKTRRALVPSFLLRMDHNPQGDILEVVWTGKAPKKADQALEAVMEVIDVAGEPLKSGEVALKLAGRFRKEDVYAALKRVRDENLAPWRIAKPQGYVYGEQDGGPQE
jgi:AAA domain-containing protein/DnaB helicase-like protein